MEKSCTDLSVSIIGSGNVANSIGISMLNAGFKIKYVYSRNIKKAQKLAKILKAKFTNNPEIIKKQSAINFICITDSAINDVAKKIANSNSVLIHTSGSTDIEVLKKYTKNCGVFYPVQTFSIQAIQDFSKINVCVEFSNKNVYNILQNIGKKLKVNLIKLNSSQRLNLHIAAVFANNFTNHMMAISENLCSSNKIDFNILKPLISETFEKIKNNTPYNVQTGPALRNDKNILKKHLIELKKNINYFKIYSFVSKSIAETYNNKLDE